MLQRQSVLVKVRQIGGSPIIPRTSKSDEPRIGNSRLNHMATDMWQSPFARKRPLGNASYLTWSRRRAVVCLVRRRSEYSNSKAPVARIHVNTKDQSAPIAAAQTRPKADWLIACIRRRDSSRKSRLAFCYASSLCLVCTGSWKPFSANASFSVM